MDSAAITVTPDAPPVTITPDSPGPSATSRFGSSLLSGLGITSNEQAKEFFTHPIKTFMDSIEAQGKLAQQAKEAYDKGDYLGAVQHGLNYLLPFIGQQTDQAGNQLKTGDIAGGIGRTLGAAIPIAAASPEVRAGVTSAAESVADTGVSAVRAAARGANTVLQKAPGSIGAAAGAAAGRATGIPGAAEVGAAAGYAVGKELLPQVRIPGEGFGLPNRVAGGPATVPAEAEAAPAAEVESAAAKPAAVTITPDETTVAPGASESIPRTLSGESVIREALTTQPTKTLLQIARSRGINVTPEAQLRPDLANPKIINKIVDDFSPDELEEARSRNLETELHGRHNFGEIGKEANQVLNLQTYFPDLKIPQTVLSRTARSIAQAGSSASTSAPTSEITLPPGQTEADLSPLLQESLKRARAMRARMQPTQ